MTSTFSHVISLLLLQILFLIKMQLTSFQIIHHPRTAKTFQPEIKNQEHDKEERAQKTIIIHHQKFCSKKNPSCHKIFTKNILLQIKALASTTMKDIDNSQEKKLHHLQKLKTPNIFMIGLTKIKRIELMP